MTPLNLQQHLNTLGLARSITPQQVSQLATSITKEEAEIAEVQLEMKRREWRQAEDTSFGDGVIISLVGIVTLVGLTWVQAFVMVDYLHWFAALTTPHLTAWGLLLVFWWLRPMPVSRVLARPEPLGYQIGKMLAAATLHLFLAGVMWFVGFVLNQFA